MSSGVSDPTRHKPACAATETSWRLEISAIESRDIILSKQGTIKALIRLRGCAGWSPPLLFACDIRHTFSWPSSHVFWLCNTHRDTFPVQMQMCSYWSSLPFEFSCFLCLTPMTWICVVKWVIIMSLTYDAPINIFPKMGDGVGLPQGIRKFRKAGVWFSTYESQICVKSSLEVP